MTGDTDAIEAEGKPIQDDEEAERVEQRRMWCIIQSANLAIQISRNAPNAEVINIMQTSEEMLEFIETGVARTPHVEVSRARQ